MDLIWRGIVVGALTVLCSWLSRRGQGALAALLVMLPVLSLGPLWAATASGRPLLGELAGKMLLAMPVWIAYAATAWALARWTDLPALGCLAGSLGVWLIAALVYLRLAG